MNTIKLKDEENIPKNFTGIVEWEHGTKQWYKEEKRHRVDGPAVELPNGEKEWWIEGMYYAPAILSYLIQFAVYLGTEKCNHNLPWLKFLTEKGIEEFPLIPGMNQDKNFKKLLIHSYNS